MKMKQKAQPIYDEAEEEEEEEEVEEEEEPEAAGEETKKQEAEGKFGILHAFPGGTKKKSEPNRTFVFFFGSFLLLFYSSTKHKQ